MCLDVKHLHLQAAGESEPCCAAHLGASLGQLQSFVSRVVAMSCLFLSSPAMLLLQALSQTCSSWKQVLSGPLAAQLQLLAQVSTP